MKKKLFAVLLASLLIVTLLPTAVFADGTEAAGNLTIGEKVFEPVSSDRLSTSLVNGVTADVATGAVSYVVSDAEDKSDWEQTSGEGSVQSYTYVGLYVTIPDGAVTLKATSEGDPADMTEVGSAFLQGGKYQQWFPVADYTADGYSLFYGGREYVVLLDWYDADGALVKSEYVKATRDLAAPVAKIGDYTYPTLASAVDAAEAEDVIELTADVVLDATIIIDKTLTIDGKDHKVSGAGITGTDIIGFQVDDGTATLKDMVLTDFDENLNAPYGSVIKIDDGHDNAKVIASGLDISDFAREAFSFKSGSFDVSNTTIDCQPDENRAKMLTKGFQIGFGNSKVTGVIRDVNIINSSSNYEEWSSAAIEVFNNATVEIIGGSISNTKTGIHVDNYWAGQNNFPTGASAVTIKGVTINAEDYAVCVYSREGQTNSVSVTINGGDFTGSVEFVDKTDNDTLTINGGVFHDGFSEAAVVTEGLVQEEQDDGSLVVRVDNSELKALVESYADLKEEDYTAESWAIYAEALESANTVLANVNATADEIAAAKTALESAHGQLAPASGTPETGDVLDMALLLAVLAISLAGIFVAVTRVKKSAR